MNKPLISVIMVDGSFRESFHCVDFICEQEMSSDAYEVIWVEYYDSVKKELRERETRYKNFRTVTLGRIGDYHSSYCFNKGILESRGNLLVIPDADVVVENHFLSEIRSEHQKCENFAMYIYRYDEPKDDHREPVELEHLKTVCRINNPTNFGGCLTVRKQWLLQINGYEQHKAFASGYHANGADIASRFKALGLYIKWHPELKLYHPYHEHTSDTSQDYEKQLLIIQHRRKNIAYLPFEGIESRLNVIMPDSLTKELNLFDRNKRSKRGMLQNLKRMCGRHLLI